MYLSHFSLSFSEQTVYRSIHEVIVQGVLIICQLYMHDNMAVGTKPCLCSAITIYLPADRSLNVYEPSAPVDVSFLMTLVSLPVPAIPISRIVTSGIPASPGSCSPFPLHHLS